MQRLPTITSILCKQTKLIPKMTSVRNLTSEIQDDNKSVNSNEDTSSNDNSTSEVNKLSGFAKAFEKFSNPDFNVEPVKKQTFANLLRHSNFINLGDPEGKIVSGKIFHVVKDDLYIDFGWKFYCVCTRPYKNGSDYVRGATVKLMIKDLELSSKFLGATKDLTILEANCTLMGLINTPLRNIKKV